MVEIFRRKRLNLPVAPLAAASVAAITALIFALSPGSVLGNLVLDSGIAAVVPAAEPPLGFTARAVLTLAGGGGLGLITWFALYLMVGTRSIAVFGGSDDADATELPVLRRADAHPDAPARRPLFANSDLGTPFLDVRAPIHVVADDIEDAVFAPAHPQAVPFVAPVEADLPIDLDQPLAAFDPHAIPEQPLDWFIPAKPPVQAERPQTFAPSERFETFELKPTAADASRARSDFDPSASIHVLLDRLEKSVVRREVQIVTKPASRNDSLQEALSTLRRLAAAR
uniref:hypothetical protein n=1 Tax=Sphingomonas sp. TaxID=28214 RepID=UPI0025FC1F5C|nr:hypothetical protein [Sphingomonas sp.]